MGWSIGSGYGGRDIGYGVIATCDQPGCDEKIDRGISYACGNFRSDNGCGLYFCGSHLHYTEDQDGETVELCDACAHNVAIDQGMPNAEYRGTYKPKPDHPDWVWWKLNHPSWAKWRDSNAEEVSRMRARLEKLKYVPPGELRSWLEERVDD